jgi:hypothetical protein
MPTPPPLPSQNCAVAAEKMAADFLAYVNDTEYFGYIHKLYVTPPFWRPLRWVAHLLRPLHERNVCVERMPGAAPCMGLVLMRNTVLRDPAQAGPALVLVTRLFSPAGLDELYDIAERIDEMSASTDPDTALAVRAIFEDDEYQSFRRRPLPACLNAPDHIQLFDELISGNAFIRLPTGIDSQGHPFVMLFATEAAPAGKPAWSAVLPSKITAHAVDALLSDRFPKPPPLPAR